MKIRSCTDCFYARAGQWVEYGEDPPPPSANGTLYRCVRGHWTSVVTAATFSTHPRDYQRKAADCPDFRDAISNGEHASAGGEQGK